MKEYIVVTGIELAYVVKAASKRSAVSKAKKIVISKGIDWIDDLDFEAYTIEEFMGGGEIHASELVYLKGSRKHIRRAIRECNDGKLFIVYYGQFVEVLKTVHGYCTVLNY